MNRITLTLTGALAALAFSAATAHADPGGVDPGAPTPLDVGFNFVDDAGHPWVKGVMWHQDFSVPNAPDETFEGVVRSDYTLWLTQNDHIVVEQDITGNVPVGEQYNDFYLISTAGSTGVNSLGLVYSDIGGTPEAFFTTPFGDINFPTWFVEAVGPNFFEPSLFFESLPAATTPAAELPGLAGDLATLLAGLW
ncbi:hypothetical protein GCM10009641_02250 [Mycobacterium cookii]|uniref:PEP-CTERM sorting domain-containing protein n=1 Tax=Mycobacterium cookii TaxID=1775 RepID=A0A7I7L404_9MYCO|nr:hypothetical protein [Mycobacterium cookii]MCV7329439.1 hypothetical protein [Mycobacterium cookii]BBX48729.1 hypothetical protein MCOO_47440 [Mycobacterium cookii]